MIFEHVVLASVWFAPPVQLIVPTAVLADNLAGIDPLLWTLNL